MADGIVRQQLYLIEILVDKVSVIIRDDEPDNRSDNPFIIKIKFGPKIQFILKEGLLTTTPKKEDMVAGDADGFRKWSREVRVGRSFLFPSYPDAILLTLSKFPLEIEVWTDDEFSEPEFIGYGKLLWDKSFFVMLKETTDITRIQDPLSVKQVARIMAECCCRQVGDVHFFLRISAMGESLITEFQQLCDKDPNAFVFRSNKVPSMFECKRVEGDDPNFCMVAAIYETTTLQDPDLTTGAQTTIEVCTELKSCGVTQDGAVCEGEVSGKAPKELPFEKIRMGDIAGPCGNTNCPLAHKIKTYIRNLDVYKNETKGKKLTEKEDKTNKVCGHCGCTDDRWHRENCPENDDKDKPRPVCTTCGGIAKKGETCEDKVKKHYGTGTTPTASKTKLVNPNKHTASKTKLVNPNKPATHYMIGIEHDPELMKSMFGTNFIVNNCQFPPIEGNPSSSCQSTRVSCACKHSCERARTEDQATNNVSQKKNQRESSSSVHRTGTNFIVSNCRMPPIVGNPPPSGQPLKKPCTCKTTHAESRGPEDEVADFLAKCGPSTNVNRMIPQSTVYNAEVKLDGKNKNNATTFCTDIPDDKECRCNPPKPTPPCNTFDCECLTQAAEIDSRKHHKAYCPYYKHKPTCPVTMMHEEEDMNEFEEEPTVEPLPYGLPPVQLGPCPVMGRPCSVPDGFARMYKTAVTTVQPPSYSDGGKVCCSKEYERIKKVLKDYMTNLKEADYRCINKYNVDTERRCCDKEQRLLSLLGKSCCGPHKLSIQDNYKDKKAEKELLKK